LLRRGGGGWQDLGAVFPEGASPGSREWSGTAIFDAATSRLQVLYTATGVRGEAAPSYQQRIFQAYAEVSDGRIASWGPHTEVVTAASPYLPADQLESAPGHCRAFRDPYYFQDPRDGSQYLLFAASLPDSTQSHSGAVGLAAWQDGAWVLQAPVLNAAGVNRELERPHLLYRNGLYYLFFSTHGDSFHASCAGRTGMYGFCSSDVRGPYTPLNGSGLVLGNPDHAPYAHYAWQMLNDGTVISFTNYPSAGPGPLPDGAAFAGCIAPFARVRLVGAASSLAPEDGPDRNGATS
jgi:levansucrase